MTSAADTHAGLEELRQVQAAFASAEAALQSQLDDLGNRHQALVDRLSEEVALSANLRVALDARSEEVQRLTQIHEQERQGWRRGDDELKRRLAQQVSETEELRHRLAAALSNCDHLENALRAEQASSQAAEMRATEATRLAQQHRDDLEHQLNGLRRDHAEEAATWRRTLSESEQLIENLSARLVDSTARVEAVCLELDQHRQHGQDAAAESARQRELLIKHAELARQQLEIRHANERSALLDRMQALAREQEGALEQAQAHALQLRDEHRAALQAMTTAHEASRAALERQLVDAASARDAEARAQAAEMQRVEATCESLRQQLLGEQTRFHELATSRATALQVLDEAREAQRLRWLHEQRAHDRDVTARLRAELSALASDRDALASELSELRRALALSQAAIAEAESAPTSMHDASEDQAAAAPVAAQPRMAEPPPHAALPMPSASEAALEPMSTTMRDTPTADDLLMLPDADFVDAAYRALLGRPPESEGLSAHLDQLRRGVPKERVLVAIAASDEARLADRRLPGVERIVKLLDACREPLLRRIVRHLWGPPDPLPTGALAVAENRLGARLQHSVDATRQFIRSLDNCSELLAQVDRRAQEIEGRLERLDARVDEVLAQEQILIPRLQAIEGTMAAVSQQAMAIETRLVALESVPQILQENHVGIMMAMSDRSSLVAATDTAGAADVAPSFDPASVLRVRSMLATAVGNVS